MPQKYLECQVCGAVLAPEDLFCGECGEPVPGAAEATAPEVEASPEPAAPLEPSPAEPVSPSVVEPPSAEDRVPPSSVERRLAKGAVPVAAPQRPDGRGGWVIGASLAGIAGILLCLVGLAMWALVASTPAADGMTEAEDFTLATLCCGLPLVGPAILLLVLAAAIWYVRVRNRR